MGIFYLGFCPFLWRWLIGGVLGGFLDFWFFGVLGGWFLGEIHNSFRALKSYWALG